MNKVAQFDLSEINPMVLVFAVLAGGFSVFVQKGVDVGIFWNVATFVVTTIVAFLIFNKMFGD
jgi:hypothetical protein